MIYITFWALSGLLAIAIAFFVGKGIKTQIEIKRLLDQAHANRGGHRSVGSIPSDSPPTARPSDRPAHVVVSGDVSDQTTTSAAPSLFPREATIGQLRELVATPGETLRRGGIDSGSVSGETVQRPVAYNKFQRKSITPSRHRDLTHA